MLESVTESFFEIKQPIKMMNFFNYPINMIFVSQPMKKNLITK